MYPSISYMPILFIELFDLTKVCARSYSKRNLIFTLLVKCALRVSDPLKSAFFELVFNLLDQVPVFKAGFVAL